MKKQPTPFDSYAPVRREVVSAAEFLRISREQPHLVARSRFIPPATGQRDFGRFEVQYAVPMLRHAEPA